jgi:hypothetical protein
MSETEDNLCLDSEGIGLTESTISVEYVQQLAKSKSKLKTKDLSTICEKVIEMDSVEDKYIDDNNCIEMSESDSSESNESKQRKLKKKNISRRFKKGNKVSFNESKRI